MVQCAGTQSSVCGVYDVVTRWLKEHGKRLKKKLSGCAAGKCVVDI